MLLTSVNNSGLPGQIVDTGPTRIESLLYRATATSETYTLNLNSVVITPYATYRITINGASVALTFNPGSAGSPLADFTSQWSALINRYGSYWSSITASGVLTLTSRIPGTSNPVVLSDGMSLAVLTRTISPLSPRPLTAGTLVFWANTYSADPSSHLWVTTYNEVPSVSEFRDCAGVVVRSQDNYSTSDLINGTAVEVMRIGRIWVTNYGVTAVSRSTTVAYNRLAPTLALPGGAIGTGTNVTGSLADRVQYDSYAAPNNTVRLRINLT